VLVTCGGVEPPVVGFGEAVSVQLGERRLDARTFVVARGKGEEATLLVVAVEPLRVHDPTDLVDRVEHRALQCDRALSLSTIATSRSGFWVLR
jgi:hypothetical protein